MNLHEFSNHLWEVLARLRFVRSRSHRKRYNRARNIFLSKAEAEFFVDAFVTALILVVQEEEEIQINRLGRFYTQTRPAREMKSNLDGSVHYLEEELILKFKPSQILLDYINGRRNLEAELPRTREQEDEFDDYCLRGEALMAYIEQQFRERKIDYITKEMMLRDVKERYPEFIARPYSEGGDLKLYPAGWFLGIRPDD
jgi:nucleoid DNA-binding protein